MIQKLTYWTNFLVTAEVNHVFHAAYNLRDLFKRNHEDDAYKLGNYYK